MLRSLVKEKSNSDRAVEMSARGNLAICLELADSCISCVLPCCAVLNALTLVEVSCHLFFTSRSDL